LALAKSGSSARSWHIQQHLSALRASSFIKVCHYDSHNRKQKIHFLFWITLQYGHGRLGLIDADRSLA
jgi:hypothetical protein